MKPLLFIDNFRLSQNKPLSEFANTLISLIRFLIKSDRSLVLSHGDLSTSNILVSGKKVYLIDCDSFTWTYRDYDKIYLKIGSKIDYHFDLKSDRQYQFYKHYLNLSHNLS